MASVAVLFLFLSARALSTSSSYTWEDNANEYVAAAWFDQHWMHIGPFLALAVLVYITMVKRYPLGSISAMPWLAPVMYQVASHGISFSDYSVSFLVFGVFYCPLVSK